MSEVLMTNVFFIITGTSVVIVSIFFLIVLYHVFKIIRTLRRIIEKIENGAEQVAEDAALLKDQLTSGKLFGTLVSYVMNVSSNTAGEFMRQATAHTTRSTKKEKKRSTKRTATKKGTKMKIKNVD